jgi:hypothetical protein
MIKALVFLFVTPFLVVGINVPRSHSLVKRNARITVPRTLQEGGLDLVVRQGTCSIGEVACTNGGCCDGSCWYAAIFSVLCHGSYRVKVVMDVVLSPTFATQYQASRRAVRLGKSAIVRPTCCSFCQVLCMREATIS